MKKKELIKALKKIPGNPHVTLPHPAVVGAVTTSVNIHWDMAGKNTAVSRSSEGNFPTLHLQRYYPRVVEKAEGVIILTIWPKI